MFLKHQDADKARDALAKEKAELVTARDALAKEKAELVTARDNERKAKEAVTQQRDAESKAKADAFAARDALANDNADLQRQLDTERAQRQQAASERDQYKAQIDRELTDTREENELLLLQLHQVQEELEHYFLQHRDAVNQCERLQLRLDRVLARYPQHVEWADCTALSADTLALPDAAGRGGEPGWQAGWQIRDLLAGGRELPQITLVAGRDRQQPRLAVLPGEDGTLPLRHPVNTDQPLVLQPANLKAADARARLDALAPSDLTLLQSLCRALAEQAEPDARPTLTALAKAFAAAPLAWRYEHVKLQHEQVNPDYEHLWFSVDGVQFGDCRWPRYQFRLSAANVRRGSFSHLPKLEFPVPAAPAEKPFDNWFEESEDERGPKFELRFDIKAPALDIGCWNALSDRDKAQALALIAHLPVLLSRLEHSGTRISRPWQDWQQLASGIRHATATCLGAAAMPARVA